MYDRLADQLGLLLAGVVLSNGQARAAALGLDRETLAPQSQARFLIPTVNLLDINRGADIRRKAETHCLRISMGNHNRRTLLRTTRQVMAVAQ